MEIFEYIRTSFHVVKAFVTQDKLIYLGLGVLGLFVVWTVLSLIFCHEVKMAKLWAKMQNIIDSGEITQDKYFEFTKNIQKMPTAVQRNWKKYEAQATGVPSDYITQQDMLDNPISGGVHKQNRSLMKFAMWSTTLFFFMLSFASLGANEVVTAKIVVESALVPFVLFMLFRLNYYIYTSVRQYEYKLAVDDFNEFISIVDSKISVQELFFGHEDFLRMNSNCNEIQTKPAKTKTEIIVREVAPISKKASTEKKAIAEPSKAQNEDAKDYEFARTKSGKIEIRSKKDFTEALAIVEKLLGTKTTNSKANDEKSKRVAELMEAMNKYRNKKIK